MLEAYTRDVGRGVARIDYDAMDKLDLITGGFIQILGAHRTPAKVLPLYPSDEGKNVIRIDGLIRENANRAIQDMVDVKKIRAPPAEKVILEPLGNEAISKLEVYVRDALEGVPFTKDDQLIVPYFGGRISFKVKMTKPTVDAVLMTQKTEVEILPLKQSPEESFTVSSEESVTNLSVEFIKGTLTFSLVSKMLEQEVLVTISVNKQKQAVVEETRTIKINPANLKNKQDTFHQVLARRIYEAKKNLTDTFKIYGQFDVKISDILDVVCEEI